MIEYICSFEEEYGFLVSASIKYGEELIRCKDCKWYYGDYCGGFGDGSFTPEDGFCHNAERKEECGHQ